jgi:hypothetical protein
MSDLSRYREEDPSDLQGLEDGIDFLAGWAADLITAPFRAISKSDDQETHSVSQRKRQRCKHRRTTIVREIVTIEEDY